MRDFFDNVTDAVRRVASNVGTEISVAAQEQKLKDAYQTLGRLYYQAVQEGEASATPGLDAQIAKIQNLIREIHEIRKNQRVSDEDFEDLT